MRSVLPWLAVVGLSIAAFVHYGNHLPQLKQLASLQQSKDATSTDGKTDPTPSLAPASDKVVTIVSPLQQLMDGAGADSNAEKAPESRPLGKPSPKDLIAPSPVGTGGVILHKTFPVAYAVNFPFVIPAHAATPQLRGHYESFSRQNGAAVGDESADIGFLVMSQEQYTDFINRQPVDALFSVDSSHDQDINFGLPTSQNQPAKFYLVFRNNPKEGKKIVKADFSVAF
jgi:hypothetical protein